MLSLTHKPIFVFVAILILSEAVHADTNTILKMFGRETTAKPINSESLELTEAEGPWLILASNFVGVGSRERAERLADARLKMGYFAQCTYTEEDGLRIDEFHNPLQTLFDKYPTLERMEVQMFERLLGARVDRSVSTAAGLTRYRFDLSPR